MHRKLWLGCVVAALLTAGQLLAQTQGGTYQLYSPGAMVQAPSPGTLPRAVQTPQTPSTPSTTQPSTSTPSTQSPTTDPGAANTAADQTQAPSAGTDVSSAEPGVIGDLNSGGYILKNVYLPAVPSSSSSSSSSSGSVHSPGSSALVRIPLITRTGTKIGENNESVLPTDRVTMGYNYYNSTNVNGSALGSYDTHVEMFQVEKTFMDGAASIGIRLPFFQAPGERDIGLNGIGDLTVITKYAFYADRDAGNVLSGGVAFTVPTGRDLHPVDNYGNGVNSNLRTVLFQPYLGYLFHCSDFYVQGFSSIIMPSDWQDNVYLANSVVGGYHLYQSNNAQCLNYIIPVIEAHLTTPLNNRGIASAPISFTDTFVTTLGVHLGLYNCSQLTFGAATPLTGPKPFDVEGIVQFSLKF